MPKKLQSVSIAAPGFLGLNKQQAGELMPPGWATEALNCVIDSSGRMAARKGYRNSNDTAISTSPEVKSIHEYIDGDGNSIIILAAGNAIYKIAGTSLTAITGTITSPSADNWHFVNFNGNCVGYQTGHTPIIITSTSGSFADITLAGTQQPSSTTDNITAAFGRMWVIDGTDLKYSDSLSTSAFNGVFDLSTVWLSGMDEGVLVTEFNGHLVIFGKRSIIVYNNPWDPASGGTLDTTQMTLVESISGIGCIARDSIQHIGNDVIFLSHTGIRSLSRTIQEKSMPLRDLSKNNKVYFLNDVNATVSFSDVKSTYNQEESMYIISLPNTNTSTGKVYYFDLRNILEDGSARMAEWDIYTTALSTDLSNNTYLGTAGFISTYQGYRNNVLSDGTGGASYLFKYHSPWNNMGEEVQSFLKIPKKIGLIVYGISGVTITVKWGFDFLDVFNSKNITVATSGSLAEYGEAEFGIAEYGAGAGYINITSPMTKSGRVIKFGIQVNVSGLEVALQQINMQAKIGKMVA